MILVRGCTIYALSILSIIHLFIITLTYAKEVKEVNVTEKQKEVEEVYWKNKLSRGWGDRIDWVKWEDARDVAKSLNKPILLIIHKSWCNACKSLKKMFYEAETKILPLARHFVMVNTNEEDEPWEEEFSKGGRYIPRIFLLDPSGNVHEDAINPYLEWKFYDHVRNFYESPVEVSVAMKKLLRLEYDIVTSETEETDEERNWVGRVQLKEGTGPNGPYSKKKRDEL